MAERHVYILSAPVLMREQFIWQHGCDVASAGTVVILLQSVSLSYSFYVYYSTTTCSKRSLDFRKTEWCAYGIEDCNRCSRLNSRYQQYDDSTLIKYLWSFGYSIRKLEGNTFIICTRHTDVLNDQVPNNQASKENEFLSADFTAFVP